MPLKSLIRLWYCWINSAVYLRVCLYSPCIASFGNNFLRPYYMCWGLAPWAGWCCSGCGCLLAPKPSPAFHKKGAEAHKHGLLYHNLHTPGCPSPSLHLLANTWALTLTHMKRDRFSVSKWAMLRGAASARLQSQQFPGLTSPLGLQGLSFQYQQRMNVRAARKLCKSAWGRQSGWRGQRL